LKINAKLHTTNGKYVTQKHNGKVFDSKHSQISPCDLENPARVILEKTGRSLMSLLRNTEQTNKLKKGKYRDIGWDGMDRIDLAQDRDQWRALVNMVMNLPVP
jgi:hypothetical protein